MATRDIDDDDLERYALDQLADVGPVEERRGRLADWDG